MSQGMQVTSGSWKIQRYGLASRFSKGTEDNTLILAQRNGLGTCDLQNYNIIYIYFKSLSIKICYSDNKKLIDFLPFSRTFNILRIVSFLD